MAFDILIVDDEHDICNLVSDILEDEGYNCRHAHSGNEAIAELKNRVPHLILLDIWLGEKHFDGIKVLELIKKDHPLLPILMMSGHGNIATAVDSIKKGAYDFIEKPFKTEKLIISIARALELQKLYHENQELKNKVIPDEGVLIGNSSKIQKVKSVVEKLAPTNSRIILEGSTGVGKEYIAKIIHRKSPRSERKFITFNCGFTDNTDILQKLLGSERDAGCIAGLLEQSHNGTLYLDCVDQLPLVAQKSVLKALQSNNFFRVNGKSNVKVDVRIISSTTKHLPDMVNQGNFLAELYHRLKVVSLEIPSLKDRKEDIYALIDYFNKGIAEYLKIKPLIFTEEALLILQQHKWSGNMRQLHNTVECLLINNQSDATEVTIDKLPKEITSNAGDSDIDSNIHTLTMPLREARAYFEKEYLLSQINRFSGNISKTADFIGMERSALHRKLKVMQIKE